MDRSPVWGIHPTRPCKSPYRSTATDQTRIAQESDNHSASHDMIRLDMPLATAEDTTLDWDTPTATSDTRLLDIESDLLDTLHWQPEADSQTDCYDNSDPSIAQCRMGTLEVSDTVLESQHKTCQDTTQSLWDKQRPKTKDSSELVDKIHLHT